MSMSLKARIKEYTAKAALDRAQLVSKEKKREQRKKQKKAERDSARELSYKTDWDIVINLDEDEFIKILIEVIEEAIMHKLEAPARISLNNEERLVYFESSLKKEDREYLAKNHKVWRQRLSQVLGLENTIRVILP